MRTHVAALLLAAMPALGVAQEEPAPAGLRLSVMSGGLATLSSDTETAVAPLARVAIQAPLSTFARGPRLHVVADLAALPGETLRIEDPRTFRSIEFSVGLSQPLHKSLLFTVYGEAGFASRLPGDEAPRDSAPRWGGLGFLFGSSDGRARLTVCVGGDQRLAGEWRPAVQLSGHAALYTVKGVRLYLVGSAVMALDLTAAYGPGTRDLVRVGIAVGR